MKTNLVEQAISLGLSLITNSEGVFIGAYKKQLSLLAKVIGHSNDISFDEDVDGNMIYLFQVS